MRDVGSRPENMGDRPRDVAERPRATPVAGRSGALDRARGHAGRRQDEGSQHRLPQETGRRRRLPGDTLIEVELGLGLSDKVPVQHRLGRLVPDGRSAGGRDRGWVWWLTERQEDLLDGRRLGDEGDDAQVGAAAGADQRQRLEQPSLFPSRQHRPQMPCWRAGCRLLVGRRNGLRRCLRAGRLLAPVSGDCCAQRRVGRQHPVVAVAVPPWWRPISE